MVVIRIRVMVMVGEEWLDFRGSKRRIEELRIFLFFYLYILAYG